MAPHGRHEGESGTLHLPFQITETFMAHKKHKVERSHMKDPVSEWVCSTRDQGPGGQVACETLSTLYAVMVEGGIIIPVLWLRKLKLRRAQ